MIPEFIPSDNPPTIPFFAGKICYANICSEGKIFDWVLENELSQKPTLYPNCIPVEYRHNAHGFRADEFTEKGDLTVLSLGCSCTYGHGVPDEFTWPRMVCDRMASHSGNRVINWNMGLCGASNDCISRMVLTAVSILQPSLIIIRFSYVNRREHWFAPQQCFPYVPGDHGLLVSTHTTSEYQRPHDQLMNEWSDKNNFYKNYKICELVLNNARIPWLFDFLDNDYSLLAGTDQKRFIGADRELKDYGCNCAKYSMPDGPRCSCDHNSFKYPHNLAIHHPGRLSHQAFAEKALERFIELGSNIAPVSLTT